MILFTPALASSRGFDVLAIDRELAIGPGGTLIPLDLSQLPRPISERAWLVPWRARGSHGRGVVLLSRADSVWVNGHPVLPFTVLRRGDEIRIDGTSLFFSDETTLTVVPFSPSEENGSVPAPGECTRCHGPIQPGDPIVSCPACGSLYMAQADRSPNCWEFGPCLCCGRDPKCVYSWQPRGAAAARPWYSRPWRAAIRNAQAVAPEPSTVTGGPQ